MTVQEWLGKDNQLGIDIWEKKYKHNNETFDEWLDRVSGGNDAIRKLIEDKKFLFGGRILANRGLYKYGLKTTYSNCYVCTPPEDNIESIFDCAKKIARTFSYGGGVGVDISKLAPKGAKVNNTAKNTTGAVSFMDLYSLVTGLIGQNGRRGALMISMDCHHPDIEQFINVKKDLDKVTNANISIRFTNDFMNAVANNEEFNLEFVRPETNDKITKTVNARDVFKLLANNNWEMAEPGCLFWDNICNNNLLANTKEFAYAGVNPCAEEPLPQGGSCLLGSINLANFVQNQFTTEAMFDFDSFKQTVKESVKALNEVLDEGLPLHPLQEQRDSVSDWRQIGLGMFGLSDMLLKLGIEYGSQESIDICNEIGFIMANYAIRTSARLAKEYGAFPKCNIKEIVSTPYFINNTDQKTRDLVMAYGLRNSQLLTIAPTGTLSTMIGVSGGIEPIFANSYTRTTKSLHGKDVEYKVYTPIVDKYMKANGIQKEADLPSFFVTAQTLDYHKRIKVQAAWQNHIDASISSTVNLPNNTTQEEVFDLYVEAWKAGLKGITIFRDGCSRMGILNLDKPSEQYEEVKLNRGMLVQVPDDLTYRKYKLSTGCGKLYLFVGIDDDGVIYDIFTNTDGVGGCTINTQANSRLLSACIRGGVPIEYVIEQLQKSGTCPSFQYAKGKGKKLSAGKSCPSAIANVLKEIIKENVMQDELKDDKDVLPPKSNQDTPDQTQICPDCGEAVRFEGGCIVCPNCGWSKCS